MDQILSLLTVLLNWRLALTMLVSIILAFILSAVFPSFTAGYCLALAIFGFAFGIYWQGRAEAGVALTQEAPEEGISWPVTVLGLAFVGFFCGGVIAEISGSRLFGATILLLGVAVVALWYRFLKQKPFQPRSLAFAIASLMAGYYLPLLFFSARGTF